MNDLSKEDLESFINDYLKEDLKRLDQYIKFYNEEIMEFVQLKNSIQTVRDNSPGGFKTQMSIGGSAFMEAVIDSTEKILIDVGKSYFVEFTAEEAIKFLNFKIAVLTKESQVFRDESVKKRAEIKLALLYMDRKQCSS